MPDVDIALRAIVISLAAGLTLVGTTYAQESAVTKAPIAVNAPGAAPDAPQSKPVSGPAPIAPDAPRVVPVPAGQVVADDYRIGPQDLIEIQVFGIDNLKREVRVNSRGAYRCR